LNINSDLEFNQNSASELKNVIFDSSVTAATTNYSVYQASGNLYWRNGSGTAVQITDGSGINTSGGSISNMTGNSQVQFSGVNKSYTFKFDSTLSDGIAKLVMSDIQLYFYNGGSATTRSVNLKYTGSGTGANTLTVPDETGTLLSTATSFAGAINIDATGGSGSITLDAAAAVSIEADTTITLDAATDINLDSDSGVINIKDGGTAIGKISNSSSDLVIENEVDAKDIIFKQYDGNEVVRMADDRRLYFFDKGGEYIYGDGSNLYLVAGTSITFSSGWTAASQTCADLGSVTTADLNGGTIDGMTIGASSHTTGKFTTCDATTDFTIGGTVITDHTIAANTGDFTLDITGDLIVDVNGGDVTYKDDGTAFFKVSFDGTDTTITNG
jgi:hypothetical protein